jgi:hypothetical protein
MIQMSDFSEDCECEEDISHFLHNLGFFHKTLLKSAPKLNLNDEQVLSLFKIWLQGIDSENMVETPMNPLQELFKQMFSGGENMPSGHPFSFRLYDDDEDEADDS